VRWSHSVFTAQHCSLRTSKQKAALTLFVWRKVVNGKAEFTYFARLTDLHEPLFAACWTVFPLAVMLAAAWVLHVWFAADWDRKHLSFVSSNNGLRIARVLYGLSLVFFGMAHFLAVQATTPLVPNWLPAHLFWAYLMGSTFIAVIMGLYARLATALSALQIGLFLVLVWIPIVAAGSIVPFQWSETILNTALLAAAWVIADSYRNTPWLAANSR